jgi:hypothetical protein
MAHAARSHLALLLERPARIDPAWLAETNINPVTGLATDFLNHFNEAVMVLEMLPMAPECADDFLRWQPMSYCEHFAASRLKHRDIVIAAYEAADPAARAELNAIADNMNAILTATRNGIRRGLSPQTTADLAEEVAWYLKPMIARAGAVINGEPAGPAGQAIAQTAVDALFDDEAEAAYGT